MIDGVGGSGLTEKERNYVKGLEALSRFGWLYWFFIFMLVVQVAATAYFTKAIFFKREIIIWQSVSQCISLLFIIIFIREKLMANRVIRKLLDADPADDKSI